jgi:hypothetical protein
VAINLNRDKRALFKGGVDMIRVNYRQGEAGLTYVHQKLSPQPVNCKFEQMKGFQDYKNLAIAEKAIKQEGYKKYKRCAVCWDGEIIDLP